MPHLDHTVFVNSCRAERGVGHHTLRAYAQDPRTFACFAKEYGLTVGNTVSQQALGHFAI